MLKDTANYFRKQGKDQIHGYVRATIKTNCEAYPLIKAIYLRLKWC